MWVCDGCGEQHEDSFAECWKCGRERGDSSASTTLGETRRPTESAASPRRHPPPGHVRYDPSLIQRHAQQLYERAWVSVVLSTFGGAFIGLLGGLVFRETAYALVVLVTVPFGGGVGFMIGAQRAFALRLQAQLALCQVAIERNTRRAAQSGG